MSLFFSLLPSDLQIDILFVWLNHKDCGWSLVRALSSLDIACSKACQRPWRWLLTQLPPFGEFSSSMSITEVKLVSEYVQWLHSRQVAVKSLQLALSAIGGMPTLLLPSVEIISWRLCAASTEYLESVLLCCPNVTSVHTTMVQLEAFTPATAAVLTKLKALTISIYSDISVNCLSMVGPRLTELRLENCSLDTRQLAELISQHCPLLQVLRLRHEVFADLLLVFAACSLLEELILPGKALNEEEVAVIIASLPHITRITVNALSQHASSIFASMLELCPNILLLSIGRCKWSQEEGILELANGNLLDLAIITRIFDICTSVSALLISSHLYDGLAELIVQRLGSGLQSLSVVALESNPLNIVIQGCSLSLKHLSLYGSGVTDELLQLIAVQHPQLETLSLLFSTVSDEGAGTVIAACPNLTDLTLKSVQMLSVQTLQAIIASRLHLQRLQLPHWSFKEEDIVWFRQQALEHQLLPLPKIVLLS